MSDDMLGKGALAAVAGPLKDLAEKLAGPDGEGWFAALKRFLRKEDPWGGSTFPIWMTVAIGGASREDLLMRLEKKGFYVSDWARDIMAKPAFVTSTEPREVSFVLPRVKDLGFTEMPTTRELFGEERLARLGLGLCEPEDGPHLRLADENQSRGTWYWLAMRPITGSGGHPYVFSVERYGDGGQWLSASIANPDNRWSLENGIVFRLRK